MIAHLYEQEIDHRQNRQNKVSLLSKLRMCNVEFSKLFQNSSLLQF